MPYLTLDLDLTYGIQYLTFELDLGGWNNVYLAFETMVALARATNRTLVLPPADSIYLLRGRRTSLTDLVQFDHRLDVITMDEFLRREAPIAELRTSINQSVLNQSPGKPSRLSCAPPSTQARQAASEGGHPALWSYLRQHGVNPQWRPAVHCLLLGAPSPAEDEAFCHGRMAVRYNQHLRRAWLLHFPVYAKIGWLVD